MNRNRPLGVGKKVNGTVGLRPELWLTVKAYATANGISRNVAVERLLLAGLIVEQQQRV